MRRLAPVTILALVGKVTYEYEVRLPLIACGSLHGGPTTYSVLFAAFALRSDVIGEYTRSRTGT